VEGFRENGNEHSDYIKVSESRLAEPLVASEGLRFMKSALSAGRPSYVKLLHIFGIASVVVIILCYSKFQIVYLHNVILCLIQL
jgi:hypothetical protein